MIPVFVIKEGVGNKYEGPINDERGRDEVSTDAVTEAEDEDDVEVGGGGGGTGTKDMHTGGTTGVGVVEDEVGRLELAATAAAADNDDDDELIVVSTAMRQGDEADACKEEEVEVGDEVEERRGELDRSKGEVVEVEGRKGGCG